MPDPNPIGQLQRRLVDLGCPVKAVRSIVRETAEHYEDLQRAAQAQGLVGAQAVEFAAEKLGNPIELANRHVEALRKSSWWGRCPQFAFGVLPLLVMLEISLQYYGLNHGKLPIDLDDQSVSYPFILEWTYPAFFLMVIAITTAVTFFFVRQAQRSGTGPRWMWITAGVLAAHGLFLQIHASNGIGLTLNQPLALSNQKLAPGHPMEIEIGGPATGDQWTYRDRLSLYHEDGDADDHFFAFAMPKVEAFPKKKIDYQPYFEPYPAQDMEEKINQGVAELHQRSLRGQLPPHSMHDPGWTASGAFSANWQHAWTNNSLGVWLDINRDNAGNIHWTMGTGDMVPWPVLSYSLPGWGYGDVFQAINIACPLLIVAAMLVWQRRKGRRLLRESGLDDGQLIGVA